LYLVPHAAHGAQSQPRHLSLGGPGGVDDDPTQARDFARNARVDFALLLDPAKAVSRSYQVDNLPMTVLIDRNGTVRYVLRDYSDASSTLYLQQLRMLLNE